MYRILTLALLAFSSTAFGQAQTALALVPNTSSGGDVPSISPAPAVKLPGLPPMPTGKATEIGGAIRTVDQVRDQITLNVFGGKDMKVLFDVRTQIYRNGQLASVQDLKPGERISIETVLDGTSVFARSIHMLTEWPGGECQGQVEYFNRGTGELTLRDSLAPAPLKLHVTSSTAIVGMGQQTASNADLSAGALVSVKFQSDGTGQGTVREIRVLAAPGSNFLFNGTVSFLDMHSGLLVVVDPRDQKQYEISFDSRLPGSSSLREGADVTVNAGFDGTRYSAKTIAVHSADR
jgi:Domain of unknown function (DUF5666)